MPLACKAEFLHMVHSKRLGGTQNSQDYNKPYLSSLEWSKNKTERAELSAKRLALRQ